MYIFEVLDPSLCLLLHIWKFSPQALQEQVCLTSETRCFNSISILLVNEAFCLVGERLQFLFKCGPTRKVNLYLETKANILLGNLKDMVSIFSGKVPRLKILGYFAHHPLCPLPLKKKVVSRSLAADS